MTKARKRIGAFAVLALVVLTLMAIAPSAEAAYLSGTTIDNGVTMVWKQWAIDSGVTASLIYHFTTNVPSTVKTGYRLQTAPSNVYTAYGNNTNTISGTFVAPANGTYNVNVYNGSSDTIEVSYGTLTF